MSIANLDPALSVEISAISKSASSPRSSSFALVTYFFMDWESCLLLKNIPKEGSVIRHTDSSQRQYYVNVRYHVFSLNFISFKAKNPGFSLKRESENFFLDNRRMYFEAISDSFAALLTLFNKYDEPFASTLWKKLIKHIYFCAYCAKNDSTRVSRSFIFILTAKYFN